MILLNEERIEFEDFIKLLSPNSSRLTKTNKSTNPIVKNYSQKNQNNIISDLIGSKEYRIFVLRNVLNQMFKNFNEE